MTDLGGAAPTRATRVVIAILSVLVLVVGCFWLRSLTPDPPYPDVPQWTVGLVVVGLLVGLAEAVSRLHDRAP